MLKFTKNRAYKFIKSEFLLLEFLEEVQEQDYETFLTITREVIEGSYLKDYPEELSKVVGLLKLVEGLIESTRKIEGSDPLKVAA